MVPPSTLPSFDAPKASTPDHFHTPNQPHHRRIFIPLVLSNYQPTTIITTTIITTTGKTFKQDRWRPCHHCLHDLLPSSPPTTISSGLPTGRPTGLNQPWLTINPTINPTPQTRRTEKRVNPRHRVCPIGRILREKCPQVGIILFHSLSITRYHDLLLPSLFYH